MRKQLFLILCFLLFSHANSQTLAERCGRVIRPQVIPIQLSERGHVFVRVNNSGPLWFILDSGSSDTVLNKRLVQKLKLTVEAVGEAEAEGGAGTEVAVLASGVTFHPSGIRLTNQQVPAIAFKGLEASLGRNIDGMLGYDFIRRFVVEVDYNYGE